MLGMHRQKKTETGAQWDISCTIASTNGTVETLIIPCDNGLQNTVACIVFCVRDPDAEAALCFRTNHR